MSDDCLKEELQFDNPSNRYGGVIYPNSLLIMTDIVEKPDIQQHWHADVEIIYVIEGALDISIDGDQRRLEPGDLAIAGSYWIHSYRSLSPDTRCLLLNFMPEVVRHRDPWPHHDQGSVMRFVSGKQWGEEIEHIRRDMEEIHSEQSHYNIYSGDFILSRLYDVLWVASKAFHVANNFDIDKTQLKKSVKQRMFIRDIIKYIDASFTSPLKSMDTALRFGISPSALSVMFLRETGRNFSQFIREKRIDYAKHLLKERTMSITQIAYKCGFESLNTFNRTFKAQTGVTPSDYQRVRDRLAR